jgi:hypothetical protein
MKYPIIKYPNSFFKILKEEKPFTLKYPIEPKPPIKSNGIFGILTAIGILLGYWLSVGIEYWVTALITFMIFFILDIIGFKRSSKFASIESKYCQEKYFNELAEYKANLEIYNIFYSSHNTESSKKTFRLQKLKEKINITIKPSEKYSNINKGISESYFFPYLIKYFPGKIFTEYIIEEFKGKKPYIPDFIFQDISTNLHIDIEIDEPYDFKTGIPTHYIDTDGTHIDSGRDYYFNDCGWVVIRFSENQIIRYPDDCCKLILAIIDNIFDLNFQNQLSCFNYLSEDCGDKNSAINSFKNKSRSGFKTNNRILTFNSDNEKIQLGDYSRKYGMIEKSVYQEGDDLPF